MPGTFDTLFDDDAPTGFFGGYRPQYQNVLAKMGGNGSDSNSVPGPAATQPNGGEPRAAVSVSLNGLPGPTYLDAEFADRLDRFEKYATGHGVQPLYISGYRSPEYQAALRSSGQGVTPAQRSLHSAGLAVDMQYGGLPPQEQQILRDAAGQAGIGWGGNFKQPDANHFYFDPGGDRQALIDNFTQQVQRLQSNQ